MSLFIRPPEDLLSYTPKFSTEETCLFYRLETREVRYGLGFSDDDDPYNPEFSYSHSIRVLGEEIYGEHSSPHSYYHMDKFDIAATIVNEYMKNTGAKPEIVQWLKDNAQALNDDSRYWKARYHRLEIEKTEEQIKELQERVRKAKIVQSMYAHEVNERKTLSKDERRLIMTEFQGEPWEE